jgi:hypothetical protein
VLVEHFLSETNADRLATAFLGSACEQWINGEFFQAIAKARPNIWARPEFSKRDLVLFPDEQAELARDPALVAESKVIYSSESLQIQHSKLDKLARQLQLAEERYPRAVVVGLLVLFDWHYRRAGEVEWRTSRAGRQRFVGRDKLVDLALENAFRHRDGVVLFRERTVQLGSYEYLVKVKMEALRAVA